MALPTSATAFYSLSSDSIIDQTILPSFGINAGDELSVTIGLSSGVGDSSATVTIDNLSTGDFVEMDLPTASPTGMTSASWQVSSPLTEESFSDGLPDFGIIVITEAFSDTTTGFSFGPGDASATLFDIVSPEGQLVTLTQILGENAIQISFV